MHQVQNYFDQIIFLRRPACGNHQGESCKRVVVYPFAAVFSHRKVNAELEEYECVKKYAILKRKLTVEEGEMTPTLKVKRNEVINHFKAEIEGLYD